MAVGRFDQVEAGGQRVNRQFLRIGHIGRRQFLTPARDQLVIVQQGDLGELRHADDAAAPGQTGLVRAQTIAVLLGELAAEEAADQEPQVMLPVMKLLQPGALVDLLFGAEGGSVVEAMQVGQAGKEFFRVGHAVDAELQLIDILRVQMDGGLLGGSEAAVGAQVEGDGAARPAAARETSRASSSSNPGAQSPSRRIFQR